MLIKAWLVVSVFSLVNCGPDIFHEGSKVTFYPDSVSEFFGYSVLLSKQGLTVGAPKAVSRSSLKAPGLVFPCPLEELDTPNITCHPLQNDNSSAMYFAYGSSLGFFRDDMWFGAALTTVSDNYLLICAPRRAIPYGDRFLLANGACYLRADHFGDVMLPLGRKNRQAYVTIGDRTEFGEYGSHLNFYAYGQAGMAVKETGKDTIILGAPGLLQWTGGIVEFTYYPMEGPRKFISNDVMVNNPYFTRELGPDDYFGYSVESGSFEGNGRVLYVGGAPRSKLNYGQVLIFEMAKYESDPLKIHVSLRGPQMGSYFGASLCCSDINNDGLSDLLVGAPNYVEKGDVLPYDQGAVFVYLSSLQKEGNFSLKQVAFVTGSGESGARFGTSIADLGDVDGDGFRDIAVGAPWENDGQGVVYVYRGTATGLESKYAQRIIAADARGFGQSISKGYDVDKNNCNDLAVGAHASSTAYLYRCIPTMKIQAAIQVPNAMDLPQNATKFNAVFCITSSMTYSKSVDSRITMNVQSSILVDPGDNRAFISKGSEYNLTLTPGMLKCDVKIVEVKPTADLSKPITIKFTLKPINLQKDDASLFSQSAARLSANSIMHTAFDIQLTRDCGEDMFCKPWLVLNLAFLNKTELKDSEVTVNLIIKVTNLEEPAYGAKVLLTLPAQPIRVPATCSFQNLNMTCDIPGPLVRGDSISWDLQMEYTFENTDTKMLTATAKLEDTLYRNVSDGMLKETFIYVAPKAKFNCSGKSQPNTTIAVTREKFYEKRNISFMHSFEVTNFGPSDWSDLGAEIIIPEKVVLSSSVEGCNLTLRILACSWSLAAGVSMPVNLLFKFDLEKYGVLLKADTEFNASTSLMLRHHNSGTRIQTRLVLDPAPPIWPIIVGTISGIILLSAIVYGLYRVGFFSRKQLEELKRLQQPGLLEPEDMEAEESGAENANDEPFEDDSD